MIESTRPKVQLFTSRISMAKIKTSQRAKNHRYNPTNAQTVNDQKNATGEQAAIDQATDAIGNIVAITASPEQIIRDVL